MARLLALSFISSRFCRRCVENGPFSAHDDIGMGWDVR